MPASRHPSDLFKRCTMCNAEWQTKDEFLADPELRLNGYQFTSFSFRNSREGGVLLFTHQRETCGTTLAIYAQHFKEERLVKEVSR